MAILSDNDRTALTNEEILTVLETIKHSDNIGKLLIDTHNAMGVKHSSYHHFPSIGAVDYETFNRFFTHGLPEPIIEAFRKYRDHRSDPVVMATFAKGEFTWMSDLLNNPYIIETGHNDMLQGAIDIIGDALCIPLFGPNNRKGYAVVGFGRDKSEFDDIMPHQVQTICQNMHIRFCELTKKNQQPVKMTKRESAVLELIAFGRTNAEIADELGISAYTVAGYVKNIFLKLNTTDRVSAALRAQSIRRKP